MGNCVDFEKPQVLCENLKREEKKRKKNYFYDINLFLLKIVMQQVEKMLQPIYEMRV